METLLGSWPLSSRTLAELNRITDSKSETNIQSPRPIVKVTDVMIMAYENDGCTFIAFTCNLEPALISHSGFEEPFNGQ